MITSCKCIRYYYIEIEVGKGVYILRLITSWNGVRLFISFILLGNFNDDCIFCVIVLRFINIFFKIILFVGNF